MSIPAMPRPKTSERLAAIYRASVQLNVTIEQVIEAMKRGQFDIIPEEER
ncbi:MAG: hypothetical protein PHZ23_16230 [Acidiphilium sp.]|nr:hypothetical protein [Acidiphilium sp.]